MNNNNSYTKFILYCVGIVAKDIEPNEFEIEVYPIEMYPLAKGDVTKKKRMKASVTDFSGSKLTATAEQTFTIKARWLPWGNGGNRISAPNVCQGETVLLFKYAGNDEYFWTTIFNEQDLRKKERVVYYYSNKKKPEKSDLLTKGYRFVVDTIDKFLGLYTEDNDGEACKYDIQLDTKNGNFLLSDSNNNGFILKSKDNTFVLHAEKDIEIEAKNNIKMTADKQFSLETKEKDIKIVAKDKMETQVGKEYKVTAEKAMDLTTKDAFSLDATKAMKLTTKDEFKLDVTKDMSLKATKNITINGMKIEIKGNGGIEIKGTGTVTVNGTQLKIGTPVGDLLQIIIDMIQNFPTTQIVSPTGPCVITPNPMWIQCMIKLQTMKG